jgi:hypothetical protein
MNNYITLDGKRYATRADNWFIVENKPHTERYTLFGEVDITYGVSSPTAWEGEIIAPVTPKGFAWGDIDNLLVTLRKKEAVSFYDHHGTSGQVHCLGSLEKRSLMNVWDDPQNVFYVSVRLVVE